MRGYVLGVDIGTSQTKCALVDDEGVLVAAAAKPYPTLHARSHYAEQDALDWWHSLVSVVREVASGVADPEKIRALSLSTQGGSMVVVSDVFAPLMPARVWTDTRCAKEGKALAQRLGAEYIHQTTGWAMGDGMMALQIANLRERAPEIFRQAAYFLSVPDFIAQRLTGRARIDDTSIGIVQLGDIRAGTWDARILEAVGIDSRKLAKIARSGEPIGTLTEDSAQALGLDTRVQVIAGAHDQYCVALGSGAIHSGDTLIATGTSWVVTGVSQAPDTRFSFGRHALDGLWGSIIALSAGGASLEWLREKFLKADQREYSQMNQSASAVAAGSEGLIFYPNLYGAQYPQSRKDLRGAFTGLSPVHGTAHAIRGVMEGVCYHVTWAAEAFGIPAGSVVNMVGGATRSKLWTQILADVLGRPIRVQGFSDVGAVGAAMIAGVGAGLWDGYEQAVETWRERNRTLLVEPSGDSPRYREILERYKRNYRLLSQVDESSGEAERGERI